MLLDSRVTHHPGCSLQIGAGQTRLGQRRREIVVALDLRDQFVSHHKPSRDVCGACHVATRLAVLARQPDRAHNGHAW